MSQRLLQVLCGTLGLTIGVVALAPATAEDQPGNPADRAHLLTYKFHADDVVRYETVQKARFVSQFQGNAETATNETHTRKSYKVVKVHPDGTAELELVIEWVRMIVDFGDGAAPTNFDSKDPAARSQAKFREVLRNVGKPQARVQVNSSGKVIKIKELGGDAGAQGAAQSIQLKDMAGGDSYSFLTIFPEKPVKVGETWSEKSEFKLTVDTNLKKTIEARRDYKLKSVDGDMATITFKTIILTPIKENNLAIQLMQRETSGELVFDMKRGCILTRNVDHDKSVINPAGNNTAMHSRSHLLERLMSETAAISDIDTNSVKQ